MILAKVDEAHLHGFKPLLGLVVATLQLRSGSQRISASALSELNISELGSNPGYKSQVLGLKALVSAWGRAESAMADIAAALDSSIRQRARPWHVMAEIAGAVRVGGLASVIVSTPEDLRFSLSFCAEVVANHLATLNADALEIVRTVAKSAPERWRPALRREIEQAGDATLIAASLLDEVGEREDIPVLRRLARQPKAKAFDRELGRRLARRLAPRVVVHDLGRVSIEVGPPKSLDRAIRRKVLALQCFLLTRPNWSATREEVMDALWPEIDPAAAINSLNQTVYFLRREYEPEYAEETTPGYVHQDSDLLWLDGELISADSRFCVSLIRDYERSRDPEVAVELAARYRARFALDFAYEDWASDFREWLHVAYLHVLETQIRADVDGGRVQRGIMIARRALEIEPGNDELELSMLKLLRKAGAYSAAAEQYGRYAKVLRTDLGVEPPPLDTVSDK